MNERRQIGIIPIVAERCFKSNAWYGYAIAMASYSYNTCACLDVNEKMQVLDTNGNVMEGLFCVGSDSAGVLFSEKKPYVTFGGANNGWALTSAYVVGPILAEYVK